MRPARRSSPPKRVGVSAVVSQPFGVHLVVASKRPSHRLNSRRTPVRCDNVRQQRRGAGVHHRSKTVHRRSTTASGARGNRVHVDACVGAVCVRTRLGQRTYLPQCRALVRCGHTVVHDAGRARMACRPCGSGSTTIQSGRPVRGVCDERCRDQVPADEGLLPKVGEKSQAPRSRRAAWPRRSTASCSAADDHGDVDLTGGRDEVDDQGDRCVHQLCAGSPGCREDSRGTQSGTDYRQAVERSDAHRAEK